MNLQINLCEKHNEQEYECESFSKLSPIGILLAFLPQDILRILNQFDSVFLVQPSPLVRVKVTGLRVLSALKA